jgi:uncharacterized protein YkwD
MKSMLTLRTALVVAVALLLASPAIAHAKPLAAAAATATPQFTDWTSSRGNVARGTLLGQSITLSGSHVTEDPYSTVDGSHTYFSQPYFSPTLPRSDAIEFRGHPNGYSYTLSFGAGIQNPVIHFGSLASTLRFQAGTSISLVSSENSNFWVSGSTVSGSLDGPNDSNGTVRLNGTFTSVSFSAHTPWYVDGIYIQVGAVAGTPLDCADADLVPMRSTHPDPAVRAAQDENTRVRVENSIICLTNYERQKQSAVDGTYRPALRFDAALAKAARNHSNDMVQRDYQSHQSPEDIAAGRDINAAIKNRVQQSGYCSTTCYWWGENIRPGLGAESTPRELVRWWMNSPGHRENILRPQFKDIGVGVALQVPYTPCKQAGNTHEACTGTGAIATQLFGSRA